MEHNLGREHAPSNLSPLESPCDHARPVRADMEFPELLRRGSPVLRHWLAWTGGRRRSGEHNPLDDHTLSDIGLSRIEMLYWHSR